MSKNKNPRKKSKNNHRQIGIKWKMLAIILTFIILFTLAMWVFQIQMLNYFYQGVKFREFNVTVDNVVEVKNTVSEIEKTVYSRAEDTYDDIWVYRVENGIVNKDMCIAFCEGSHDSRITFLQKNFDEFYIEAKNNSNTYTGVFSLQSLDHGENFELEFFDDNKGKPDSFPRVAITPKGTNAIRLDIIPLDGGSELFIVQCSNLVPMSALGDTIKSQVIFTSLVLIVFAVVLVGLMARFITIPIIRINESAKRLGKGKYDVEFKGDNYREISELSDTLNYVSLELSKNDKLQKELISNISHDLRTPLTMIRGYSELMRDIPGEVTPENFQIIIDETTRLTELVNGMLDLSKIQSGVRMPDKQLFCITEIIKTTLVRYEKFVTQESYKIDFEFDDEVFVCADRSMILQVLYNFINNAINYTGEDKYVRVEQKIIGNSIRVSISDTGDGISDEQLPYIWDRYYRGDKVHRRATVGTGLGLSIVKSILEAHGAKYGVESKVGEGSIFYFELERVDPNECESDIDY